MESVKLDKIPVIAVVGATASGKTAFAVELAKREENKGKNIVVLLPDTGERYLSTPGYIS